MATDNEGKPTLDSQAFEFLDSCEDLLSMLDGYRAKLINHGYSETAAEQMVVQMHGTVMIHAQMLATQTRG